MEAEIAKLLNCRKEDTDRLHSLIDEYLFESESDSSSDQSEDESSVDDECVDYDMRMNDLDTVLDSAKHKAEVVVEFGDELEKVKKFWYVSYRIVLVTVRQM